MTEKDIRKRIADKFGDVEFELIEFNRSCDPVVYKCLNCGRVFKEEHLQNVFKNKIFCPCYPLKNSSYFSLSAAAAQQKLDNVFGGEYEIIQEKYNGWVRKGLIRHTICGKIFSCVPRALLFNKHCPCVTITQKEKNRIEEVLKKYGVEFEKQKRLPEIKQLPFDFYLPKYNLLIDFQGQQHFEPTKKFGGEKQFIKQQEFDRRKQEVASQHSFSTFEISYKEQSLIEEILVQRLSLTGVDSSESKCQSPQEED